MTDCHSFSMLRGGSSWVVAVCGLLLCIGGCEAPGPTPIDFGVRHVERRDRAALLDSAEAALINAGFAVERRDADQGLLTGVPVEGGSHDAPSRPGGLSSRSRTRRVAEVRLEPSADSFRVYCKVMVQEQVTRAYGMFNQERGGSDSPGENTAINRDAATTTEQNTVWRTIRRDKPAERRILDSIAGPNSP